MAGKPEFMRLAGGHCRNGKSPFRALTPHCCLGGSWPASCRNGKSPFRALTHHFEILSHLTYGVVEMERARLGR